MSAKFGWPEGEPFFEPGLDKLNDWYYNEKSLRMRNKKTTLKIIQQDCFWILLLILTLGAVYTTSLLQGVGYQCDTAKFQFVGRVLGTPHPTGFPTYLFFNHVFTTFFPLGSLAYKANLLSALLSLFSIVFLFLTLKSFFQLNRFTAFMTALTFGVTFTLWSQSIVAEVYTLHLLFLISVVYYFLKWDKTRNQRYFLLACALYAFSFGNHLSMILFFPAIVFWVWSTNKNIFIDLKKIVWVLFFIILGVLQYSYFFWRFYSPDTPYLEMATPNLERFFWFITGAHSRSRMFSFSMAEVITQQIPWFLKSIAHEFLFLLPVAVLGIFTFKNRRINIFLMLIFLGNMVFSINYNIAEIFVYLIPNYLIIALYIGIGLGAVFRFMLSRKISQACYLFLLIPLIFFLFNHKKMEPFNSPHHAKRVEFILAKVKKDALIISPDDYYSQFFWYYLIGEGLETKKNIYLIHHFNMDQIREYIDENKPFYLPEERKYVPQGLKVYCIHCKHRDVLQKSGFRLLRIRHFLYKVMKPFRSSSLSLNSKKTKYPLSRFFLSNNFL